MKIKFFKRFLYFFLLTGITCSLGCSAKNGQQQSLKEYRKIMERQKVSATHPEEDPGDKISETKASDYERLGDSYLRQGNIDLAFFLYSKALRLDPAQTRVRYKTGRLLLERGLTEEAKKEFQVILERDPDYALAYEGIGRVFFKMGNFKEAEKNFIKALRIDSNLWQAHNFLGIIYDRQGQFESAISQYKSAISLQPNNGILFNNLGVSLFLMGENEKAIRAFLEAAEIENSNKKIYNNLALALCKSKRYLEGFDAFKKAGDEASAYYNMGCIFMLEGRYKEAVESFEKAIQLKPVFYIEASEKLKKAKNALNESNLQ